METWSPSHVACREGCASGDQRAQRCSRCAVWVQGCSDMSLPDITATHCGAQSMKRPEFTGGLQRELESMLPGSQRSVQLLGADR